MKHISLISIILLFVTQCIAQEAEIVKMHDTRSVEFLPSNFKKGARFDLKLNTLADKEQFQSAYSMMFTLSPWYDDSAGPVSQIAFNKSGMFFRQGYCGNTGYGIIDGSKNKWESWGKIIIGDSKGVIQQKLEVDGIIHAKEVLIDTNFPLADYVFKSDYKLMSLNELEQFVQTNKHLPEIPSAEDVAEKGLSIGEMQNKLLQKIEELTLYIIDQNKQITELQNRLKELPIE